MYWHILKTGKDQMKLCMLSRPPSSKQNEFKITKFGEWSTYLDQAASQSHEIILTGDYHEASVLQFTGQLDANGLVPHMTGTANKHGRMLDLVTVGDINSADRCTEVTLDCKCTSTGEEYHLEMLVDIRSISGKKNINKHEKAE